MSPSEILKMPAGPALDEVVHQQIFGGLGECQRYSTQDSAALTILDRVPLFIARIDPGRPDYNPERPFVAGRHQHEQSVKGDVTILRVTAATKALALCKAALMALAKIGVPEARQATAMPQPSISERIGDQVAKRKKAAPAPTVPLRKTVAQPLAGVTKTAQRPPLPPRKPFVPGVAAPQKK